MRKKLFPILLLIAGSTIFNSCKKESEPEPDRAPTPAPSGGSTTGAPTITSSYYFQAKIDGTWVTYQDGVGGYASGTGGSSYGTTVNQEEQSALMVTYPSFSGAYFFILKTFPGTASGTDYESMFSVRSYTYGIKAETPGYPNGVDGAGLGFVDASGVQWRTDYGTHDQTGSTFNITEHVANTDGYSHRISKATFSCKLYDGHGNVKTVTNGIFHGRSVIY
jgi:hypothetical protein